MDEPSRARIRFRADAAAVNAACRFVELFAAERGIAGEDVARFLIAVEELATNVVKYGYAPGAAPGALEVRARLAGGRFALVLIDDGGAFNPFDAPEPDLDAPIEARRVGGLGLHIVKAWMDRRRYRRAGRYNVVAVSRAVSSA